MKKQNVLHTEQVNSNNKTYYLDLKKAENGNNYLVITQSKAIEDDKYERIKMILFENEVQQFASAFSQILFNFNRTGKPQKIKDEKYIEEVRKDYPNAFQPWTKEDEELLTALFNEGKSVDELAKSFQRNVGGIRSRLDKLGLASKEAAA